MALESLPKIAPALFSAEQDLIQIYNKKSDTVGTINASYIGGSTPPSGVSGAIQFSNGSAFASDSANLFWDNVNKRLGIGLNTPVAGPFQVKTTQSNANGSIIFANNTTATILAATDTGSALTQLQFRASSYNFTDASGMRIASTGYATTPTAMLQIVGSGSTSATTSLLVQNSSGTAALTVDDSRNVIVNGQFDVTGTSNFRVLTTAANVSLRFGASPAISYNASEMYFAGSQFYFQLGTEFRFSGRGIFGSQTFNATAQLQVDSTTKGFLPPRMTTAQKNAIGTPAAGLVVFDTDLNKLCVRGASAWETITSV